MNKQFLVRICLIALLLGTTAQPARPQGAGLVIPEGTEIQLSLAEPLSSKLNEVGDEVFATVRRDVFVDGQRVLRRGAEVVGRVTLVQAARRPLKGGKMHVTFDRVRFDGQEYRLSAIIRSASDFARDEKISTNSEGTLKQGAGGGDVLRNVGTAAGIGMIGVTIAILSSTSDRSFGGVGLSRGGAVTGAAVLGGSVVAGVLLTRGKEVRLDQGAIIRLRLERPLNVE